MELAHYVAAVRRLSDVIRTGDSGPNRVRRAYVHLLVRNHEGAAADARVALERPGASFGRHAHSEVEAHWILAEHYDRQGNCPEALRHCRQALYHPATKGYPAEQAAKLEGLFRRLKAGNKPICQEGRRHRDPGYEGKQKAQP